ncbi:hypothetical protein [Zooshikella harenae]|uniref:Uncharacterized protein n=1 Tax=Zooshikella harenae TaxID=2827238 RepID=A0ABS5ZJK4_9GAMM|nr:hypothetical protein [Zooshikella harenae]MBU2713400.1 hypothetical protein [Zooshikella harenae]
MLQDYTLVCMDCGEGFSLGEAIFIKYNSVQEITYGYSAITNNDNPWSILELKAAQIQHFLMQHRLHEIRVLPQGVEKYTGSGDFPSSYLRYDNIKQYLATKVKKPQPDVDLNNINQCVIETLKGF